MTTVILLIHLLIALALVGVVLLQRSEGGGLGIGGGGSSFMTGRGTANFLTRVTAGLAAAFFLTSITLTLLARQGSSPVSPLDRPAATVPASGTPASGSPAAPDAPGAPAAKGGVLDSLEKGRSSLPSIPKSQ
jgi:preprotein translocase subunit SecG